MKKRDVINMVYKIAEKIAGELDYDLVDIEYVKEFGSFFLKVYIDKLGGITIDDCQKMSEILGQKLDENDPIKEAYYLEVSSPGLDRPLKNDKDFKRNIDKDVEIKLYKTFEEKKIYEGILKDFTENLILILDNKDNIIEIPRDIISTVKLTIKF
jgi:ribosome maturation factor RimP